MIQEIRSALARLRYDKNAAVLGSRMQMHPLTKDRRFYSAYGHNVLLVSHTFFTIYACNI